MQMDCLGLRILGAHPIALHTLIGGKTSTAPGISSPYAWTMNDTCKKEVFQFFFSNIGSLGIQSYCQMMSKGCTITDETHSVRVPWNHSQELIGSLGAMNESPLFIICWSTTNPMIRWFFRSIFPLFQVAKWSLGTSGNRRSKHLKSWWSSRFEITHVDVSKNRGKTPQIIPCLIGFGTIIFTIHFGIPLFLEITHVFVWSATLERFKHDTFDFFFYFFLLG